MEKKNWIETEEKADDSSEDLDADRLYCTNMDPGLATLVGLLVEEESEAKDWSPPGTSGLENSKRILSRIDGTWKLEKDIFAAIKNDILDYKPLTKTQLEHIKLLNQEEKIEIIELYNRLIEVTGKALAYYEWPKF